MLQVREDCRRRMADAEKRAAAKIEHLENRLRNMEAELTEALQQQQQQRYHGNRQPDPVQLREASTQVELRGDVIVVDDDDDENRISRRRADESHMLLAPSIVTVQMEETKYSADATDVGNTDTSVGAMRPKAQDDDVWYRLYETVTALALNRVRYLEELVSAGNQRRRPPEADAQLRRLQAARRRVVAGNSSSSSGGGVGREGARPLQPTAVNVAKSAEQGNSCSESQYDELSPNGMSSTKLRRTSSCPVPETADVEGGEGDGVDGAVKENRRADDVVRSQSADELMCDVVGGSADRHAESAKSPTPPSGDQQANHSNLSTTTMSELCDSAFGSIRTSPSPDDTNDVIETDFRSNAGDVAAGEMTLSGSPTPRSGVVNFDVTEVTVTSKGLASKSTKRHASLHLDIFRKLQTGVTGKRRDRIVATAPVNATVSSDDDRSDSIFVNTRKSTSPSSSWYSSSSGDVSAPPTPLNRSHVAGIGVGPLRAVHGSAATSISDTSSTADGATGSFSPPPTDASSSSTELRESLLRRSLPLSLRRRSRDPASRTSSNPVAESNGDSRVMVNWDVIRAANDSFDEVAEMSATLPRPSSGSSQTASGGSTRVKSSSFGRLQERRNGLTSESFEFRTASGGLGGHHRMSPQSRFDNLARNIKTYLTN
jgi:hypothetical protein